MVGHVFGSDDVIVPHQDLHGYWWQRFLELEGSELINQPELKCSLASAGYDPLKQHLEHFFILCRHTQRSLSSLDLPDVAIIYSNKYHNCVFQQKQDRRGALLSECPSMWWKINIPLFQITIPSQFHSPDALLNLSNLYCSLICKLTT